MSMLCTLLSIVLSSVGDSSEVGEERRDLCRADQKTDCHSVVYVQYCVIHVFITSQCTCVLPSFKQRKHSKLINVANFQSMIVQSCGWLQLLDKTISVVLVHTILGLWHTSSALHGPRVKFSLISSSTRFRMTLYKIHSELESCLSDSLQNENPPSSTWCQYQLWN